LDIRDYKADKPISFRTMASLYLEYRQDEMSGSAFREIRRYLIYAINYWGDKNIKTIGYSDFEDFLKIRLNEISTKEKLSYKTINNAKSALQSFFTWVHLRDRSYTNS
jgi:site-specific recombinase XerD